MSAGIGRACDYFGLTLTTCRTILGFSKPPKRAKSCGFIGSLVAAGVRANDTAIEFARGLGADALAALRAGAAMSERTG